MLVIFLQQFPKDLQKIQKSKIFVLVKKKDKAILKCFSCYLKYLIYKSQGYQETFFFKKYLAPPYKLYNK